MAKKKVTVTKEIQRMVLPVHSVGKSLAHPYKAINTGASFQNTGGMNTFITAVNNSGESATITFLSLSGKTNRSFTVEEGQTMTFAHFVPSEFNQIDNSVRFDIDGELMIVANRLGI